MYVCVCVCVCADDMMIRLHTFVEYCCAIYVCVCVISMCVECSLRLVMEMHMC